MANRPGREIDDDFSELYKEYTGPLGSTASRAQDRLKDNQGPQKSQRARSGPHNSPHFQRRFGRQDKAVEDPAREDLRKISRNSSQGGESIGYVYNINIKLVIPDSWLVCCVARGKYLCSSVMYTILNTYHTVSFHEAYGNDRARGRSIHSKSPGRLPHADNSVRNRNMGAYRTDGWDMERRASDLQYGNQFEYCAFPQALDELELELEYKREAMDLWRIRDKEEDEENHKHREAQMNMEESYLVTVPKRFGIRSKSLMKEPMKFSVIVNGLKGFGEVIPNEKLVSKMIYSLPKSWQSKKTTIIEDRGLKSLTLDELIGSLLTHEMMLKEKEEKKNKKKNEVGIAFKSINESYQDSSDEVDEDDDEQEDEMAKLFKELKRFMTSKEVKNESSKKKSPPLYFNCQRTRHVKYDCPLLRKKRSSKKKAFVATWSDEDDSNDDEEVVNLCLMANEEEFEVCGSNGDESDDIQML
ncbi:Zinc knuckle family protein isoform 1 [Hibiscus syriacus]|uniref:Zinc knuckle family protein isoform 1 n=1 Tax=Hibiscus syriacus TaxID=106335 RepID=A0A6A2ZAV7_HIBSY|nr:Zinc knuckle family protein isoform 1 [Hibiscus syriacus]